MVICSRLHKSTRCHTCNTLCYMLYCTVLYFPTLFMCPSVCVSVIQALDSFMLGWHLAGCFCVCSAALLNQLCCMCTNTKRESAKRFTQTHIGALCIVTLSAHSLVRYTIYTCTLCATIETSILSINNLKHSMVHVLVFVHRRDARPPFATRKHNTLISLSAFMLYTCTHTTSTTRSLLGWLGILNDSVYNMNIL